MKESLTSREARKILDKLRKHSYYAGPVIEDALSQMILEDEGDININFQEKCPNLGLIERNALRHDLNGEDVGYSVEELIAIISEGKYTDKGIARNCDYFKMRRVESGRNHNNHNNFEKR